MTTVEHVQALMQDLGPATPEIEGVAQRGHAAWAVVLPDELIITLELDPTGRTLVLSADVGRPPEEAKFAAYELALTYAYLWRDTGGARLALGGADGELTLLYDLVLADLTLSDLQSVLLNVAEKAQIWRRYLAGVGETPATEEIGVRI